MWVVLPIKPLVQRLVDTRYLLVGRVPFGSSEPGAREDRWNLRVNGHQLRRGRYLITLRMFDRRGHLIALARPTPVTVK